MSDFLLNIDYWVFNQINAVLTFPFLDPFFFWLTDLHKTLYFKIIIVPLVAYLFIKNFKRQGVALFLILLITLGINDFIGGQVKKIVKRPRPENNPSITVVKRSDAGSFSFYSNHASNMFTFATYTVEFIPQLKLPLYTIATLVAYSRVYNGVHYPSDILTGGFFGYLWGLLFSRLTKKLLYYLKNRKKTQ